MSGILKVLILLITIVFGSFILISHLHKQPQYSPLVPVDNFNLQKYLGDWYEISAFPVIFRESCYGSKITYSQQPTFTQIVNSCHMGSFHGGVSSVFGQVRSSGRTGSALCISYNFQPQYQCQQQYIIVLDEQNYSYAVLGSSSRENLWIISRTPQMDDGLYKTLVQKAKDFEFDTSKLRMTPQQKN